MTTVKITELSDIGANLASSTVIPVVNMAGTPITQKTNVGNIANIILEGAGVDYPEATVALLAQTVSNAAQPNITSVGTLTNVVVSGNATVNGNITSNGTAYVGNLSTTGIASITTLSVGTTANLGAVGNVTITGGSNGQVLTTNGSNVLSWTTVSSGNSSYSDSNVVTLLSAFGSNTITTTGNISGGNLVTGGQVVASGNVSSGTGLSTGGFLSVDGTADLHNTTLTGYANITGTANVVGGGATVGVRSILAIDSAFGSNNANDPASAQAVRGRVTGNNLTKTRNYVAGVTGQYLVTGTNASEFINTGLLGVVGDQTTTANAAVVAYLDGDGGLTTAGSAYGVSMKNSTPGSGFDYGLDLQFIDLNVAGTTTPFKQADIRFNNGVELVANTANNISINADVTVGNITATNLGNIATINLDGSNANVLYGNGVFAPAAGGGNSSQISNGNSNVSIDSANGNITIAVSGTDLWSFDSAGHFNLSDDSYIGNIDSIGATGFNMGANTDFAIQTNDGSNTFTWKFGNNGELIVPDQNPGQSSIISLVGNSNLASFISFVTPDSSNLLIGTTGNNHVIINTDKANANIRWSFDDTGNLTLPNTANVSINYANGSPYGGGGNGTPGGSNTQIQFNDNGNFGANSGFTFDSTTGNISIPGTIISGNTITIDNRASGNGADINLYSADDILIQARDRDIGSTSEGGDINIYAGDSAEDSDTSAGDIVIEAGAGGASNIDFGGSGGFVRVEAGQGGAAVGANFAARPGGNLTLRAGDAGNNGGNIDLGASGGDVIINAGDSTGNGNLGGNIYLTSGAADASGLAGDVVIQAGGTWTFDGNGIIQLPNSGTISNDGNNIDIGSTSAISLEASSAVNIYTDTGTNTWQWQFQDDGNLRLPTIELDVGNTINEQTVIQSQRKIIPGLRYSAEITGTTPTVVYTATSVDTTSMKVTMQIQHIGLGFEFFDVSATSTGGNTYYTVSNRVQPPTIDNSDVVVDLNGSNIMEITVTINSGAANSWVTYDATEFGIAVD